MGIVSFRVDDELKKKMELLKRINWSELLRQFVSERVTQELVRSYNPVIRVQGSRLADEIQAMHSAEPGWDSAEELRRWRDQRR